ncbi:mediator of RNA polymerase II transcription subunit 12-like [Chenopodium quinoa]|uniref:mediator of RNA polymerase II transcription subunit 12-like n=1 Tax=Chenopodium quinoa TaxID=63459 RepID=UPI000B779D91|nr:mediator of RNA polymerase II transcription subunit 12-like [Chenopodium quinoa]XP_021767077.1 mediator of RNA polymerase II transcription subunit 12-like [Chenopodium quinoa]XP_021767078.1 mediator of RNA polymerase II transcription subunit 12-like [Chenopodium quinoa]XP_021767079.1 mediator of RNA polymerase II transcription subunit 12-like [Chenopodium quinoa]XP_021767080.1 mediator of RNA polymerase II transcription subunit 12-like [Chenopodium quinoa]
MQRYHAASCTSAVNNNTAIGGISNRDTNARNDSSLSANFSLNSRRTSPLTPYKLKCEKEPLNSRLGAPDFHPQTVNCPEETLTKEYVQSGYRETVEGLEETKELSVTQVNTFTAPVVLKCKEAIRKRLRAINESRAQKRKAGQVYGEPLSGSLLSKSCVFPEQKSCGEDFKKRWIEGLSQYPKSLRSLADHVPHGYRKKSLFEVLIRNNVPLLRATWFIKVTYLNQIRPGSSSVSSGSPDRIQLSRTEIWTKDVTDYLQYILDEFFSRNSSHSRSQQMLYAGSVQKKSDQVSLALDSEEPSLHTKWWYVVRILHWHHAEGLILPSQVIDWVFLQFQDKDLLKVMQFLLPIIYGVLETITTCQTYVRKLVEVTLRFLKEASTGCSDPVDNSRRAYTCSALVEMLQYLILSVPDTFVGLDCFPLPHCLMMSAESGVPHHSKSPVCFEHPKDDSAGVSHVITDKRLDVKHPSSWFRRVVSSIKKRSTYLAKAASPGYSGQNVAKAVQALDKAFVQGDVQEAYKLLFEGISDSSVHEGWIGEVSPCLRSSLKWIRYVGPPLVYSVFLLCEWCTCDFRDFRTSSFHDVKFTGRKDFSQLYVTTRLMKQKMREIQRSEKGKKGSESRADVSYDKYTCIETSDYFESPGPLHDIILCWLDQHDAQKGEGSKRVQLLLIELTRFGIFSPLAYARQLLVSGIMDNNGPVVDPDRRKRHFRILKQLSVSCMLDVFDEDQSADRSLLLEAIHVYSNERCLLLRGLLADEHKQIRSTNYAPKKQKEYQVSQRDHSLPPSIYQLKTPQTLSAVSYNKSKKNVLDLEKLKLSILELLLLPKSAADAGADESQVNMKRSVGLISGKLDIADGTPGCEECRRAKRQKIGGEKYSFLHGPSSNPLDDEDNWWVRKEPKSVDSLKVEQPIKPSKQASRGRQKSVRKTQSLAQLAASRIEGSQGASTSHVCDNKVGCPHHRPVPEGDAEKSADGNRAISGTDIVSIGKKLKRLKYAEKRSISAWLVSYVKQVVEETERTSTKGGQVNRSLSSVDEKSSAKWKLGEDELSVILYLMDMCTEVPLAISFLVWLLPKALGNLNAPIHGGRNMMVLPRNVESHACEVKEPFLLSAIRRYENIILAVDLLPEILSSTMHRAAAVLGSNGRLSGSPTFLYARYLLKKYCNVSSVIDWEKSFKATCDKRLLSELESGKLQNGEFGFSFAVPAGVEDLDDFIRQKISSNRSSRMGMSMREIVQRCVEEAVHHLFGKERKLFGLGAQKNAGIDKWDDGYQIAQQIVVGLIDCIRQTGGAAQEGDPALVSSAVSAIVGNVGPAIAKMPDFTSVSNHSNFPAPTGSLSFARRVLRIHINCLCLLKEALGERHSRAFEVALATEASSALAGVLLPGKNARGQYHMSPDAHDSSVNLPNEVPNNSTKVAVGRATKISAAVSALIIGAIIHGVSSLERMVTVFRLRDGLDLVQFVRSSRTHSNGNARSAGALKIDNALEVYIHWFRLLVGNCRAVSDGVIVELLGEPSVIALSRMQRTLPINLVLPPAYSLFAFMIWRPFIFSFSPGGREEIPQLLQSLSLAIGDAIKHAPFRDICLRDTHGFFDIVTSDTTDAEFASILELNGSDRLLKAKAFIPLRARLFLNALVDCKLPHSVSLQDDGIRLSGTSDAKVQYEESETNISDRLVSALDTLQPAKFHWQWVELRLFLSELTLISKLDSNDTLSVAEAIRCLTPNPDKGGPLENENNFIPIVLTRLLVRPDAAPLFSEVVRLFGRSLEDSLLLHVKWFLEGHDVLFGKKSIRQRLVNFADSKGFSTKAQFSKPWGWANSNSDSIGSRGDKRRFETPSVEEGEVVEEDYKRHARGASKQSNREGLNTNQQFVTERALMELVLPCIDRSPDDSRNRFASELIKQMNNIEQQISGVTSGSSKQTGSSPSGSEGFTSKSSTRKSMKGSSPGLARRAAAVTIDSAPSSPSALRASISLRLQLLVRLLPSICADGDSSSRSSRFMLASAILRLLGSRVVYEDVDMSFNPRRGSPLKEAELQMETCADVSLDLSGKNLFDWLLLVLHALLNSSQPSWLRLKSPSKSTAVSSKDFAGFDREILENLQSELDRMHLPDTIRWRIQAAMPVVVPNLRTFISCQPPSLASTALASLQPSVSFPSNQASPLPKNILPSVRTATSTAMLGKSKSAVSQPDNDLEVDPWMLLEDGAGSGSSSSNTAVMGGGDHANLKASSWLKGAVRVRRTDLTYIGAVDEDS